MLGCELPPLPFPDKALSLSVLTKASWNRRGMAWHVCVFLVPHTMDEYLPTYLSSTVRRRVHVHVQV